MRLHGDILPLKKIACRKKKKGMLRDDVPKPLPSEKNNELAAM